MDLSCCCFSVCDYCSYTVDDLIVCGSENSEYCFRYGQRKDGFVNIMCIYIKPEGMEH